MVETTRGRKPDERAENDPLPNGYDIFLSHNRADKQWVRELARRLAAIEYNGRPLRPWLDEQVIDPGPLSDEQELTSALDRSRFLGLVLSPGAVASPWVELEIVHFLGDRRLGEVLCLLRQSCQVPPKVADAPLADFRDDGEFEARFGELVETLCPPGEAAPEQVVRRVDEAWEKAVEVDPGGMWPDPTPEREAVLAELQRHDIDSAAGEGLALTAFRRAAELLLELRAAGDDKSYNMKMLLAECLALGLLDSPRYRQVLQRLLELEDPTVEDPVLHYVAVRVFSKLAELDLALIDLSVLWRVAARLDAGDKVTGRQSEIGSLVGRTLGKLRGADPPDFLVKRLATGGAVSRIAAAAAISTSEGAARSAFFTRAMAELAGGDGGDAVEKLPPPLKRHLGELEGLDLDDDPAVVRALRVAKDDLARFYGISERYYGWSWFERRHDLAGEPHLAPFLGTAVRATTANMVELAGRVDRSHVVCFTEPRVVDALFDGCGAVLLPEQAPDSPQCTRMRGRSIPFAMVDAATMAEIEDGQLVAVDERRLESLRSPAAR